MFSKSERAGSIQRQKFPLVFAPPPEGFWVEAGLVVTFGLLIGDDPPCDRGGDAMALNMCLSMTAETKAVLGGVVFGVAGMLVGRSNGAAASSPDKVSYPPGGESRFLSIEIHGTISQKRT